MNPVNPKSKYEKIHPLRWSTIHRVGNDPCLDWIIMIILSVILTGVLIWVGLTTYTQIDSRLNDVLSKKYSTKSQVFDVKSLNSFIGELNARAELSQSVLNQPLGVSDPLK